MSGVGHDGPGRPSSSMSVITIMDAGSAAMRSHRTSQGSPLPGDLLESPSDVLTTALWVTSRTSPSAGPPRPKDPAPAAACQVLGEGFASRRPFLELPESVHGARPFRPPRAEGGRRAASIVLPGEVRVLIAADNRYPRCGRGGACRAASSSRRGWWSQLPCSARPERPPLARRPRSRWALVQRRRRGPGSRLACASCKGRCQRWGDAGQPPPALRCPSRAARHVDQPRLIDPRRPAAKGGNRRARTCGPRPSSAQFRGSHPVGCEAQGVCVRRGKARLFVGPPPAPTG